MMVRPVSRPKITGRHLCSRSCARSIARLKMPAEIAATPSISVVERTSPTNTQELTATSNGAEPRAVG